MRKSDQQNGANPARDAGGLFWQLPGGFLKPLRWGFGNLAAECEDLFTCTHTARTDWQLATRHREISTYRTSVQIINLRVLHAR